MIIPPHSIRRASRDDGKPPEHLRKLVYFPTEEEAARRLLAAHNRRRAWLARAALVVMMTVTFASFDAPPNWGWPLVGVGVVAFGTFVVCCVRGAVANERR